MPLQGTAGTFIAIAPSKEEAMRLRDVAERCLHEPVLSHTLELVSWKDSVRRIWCSGPRPEYRCAGIKRCMLRYSTLAVKCVRACMLH